MIQQELHAAHLARQARMRRYARASYEPPPAPRPAPPPPQPDPAPIMAKTPDFSGPIGRILQAVAQASGVAGWEIISPDRRSHSSTPRHVFFWMCRTMTHQTDPAIGKFCGGRNHSTVHWAVMKIERRMAEYQGLIDASKKALDDMPRLGDET